MYGQLAIQKLNKKDNFVWEKAKYEILPYHNSDILHLNIFKRLIALSELNFYNKAD